MSEPGKVEVQVLACPACGAPIKGSGACGSCSQLLLVTREYGVLNVTDQDIGDIKIIPPSKDESEKSKDPNWMFSWQGGGWSYSQTQLTILGKGSPSVGSRLVAMYYNDHPEINLPGVASPAWRSIEDYSIAKVLASQANK